jgi:hypothetical protein
MNTKILGLLAVGLTAGPIAANAQTTTLDYQGTVMNGISIYLPVGQTQATPLPTANFTGTLTASLTLTGSLSANDLTLVSYDINLNGRSNGTIFSLTNITAGPPDVIREPGGPIFCGTTSCIDLTTSHGAFTGATIDLTSFTYHSNFEHVVIGPTGDSFSFAFGNVNGGCESILPANNAPYMGPTINPCRADASNSKAGVWTVTRTPEIDPASAVSGLTLLLGGVAVLRGRRAQMVPGPESNGRPSA